MAAEGWAIPCWEPGGRQPAPGPVRLVQLFLNSCDELTRQELLGTSEELEAWLARRGFERHPQPVRPAEVARVLSVREALRQVCRAHNGGPPPGAGHIRVLNREAERACLRTEFDGEGEPRMKVGGTGVDGLLSSVFASALVGRERGMWSRMKSCRECGWVFYDHSRNGRGSWCTMTVCGSRAKMRAYRRRRAGEAS